MRFILMTVFVGLLLPIMNYPLTDADIAHWVGWAKEISIQFNFLSAATDQAHGPLLPWLTGCFISLFGDSFWVLNLFNLCCTLFVLGCIYKLVRFSHSESHSLFSVALAGTCIIIMYFSRTPMYDWPAACFFFGFITYYYLYRQTATQKMLVLALGCIGLASLSRFSISIGLAGLAMIIYELWVRDNWQDAIQRIVVMGISILGISFLLNLPWVLSQMVHDPTFLGTFINDNLLRFFRDHPGDVSRRDYYGFFLYALISLFPWTPLLLAGISRSFFKDCSSSLERILLVSILPCLLIFSLSGHTKLARYIAYIYPGLCTLTALIYLKNKDNTRYFKRLKGWFFAFFGLLSLLLIVQVFTFTSETADSPGFVFALIVLLSALFVSAYLWTKDYQENPLTGNRVIIATVFYTLFFSYVGYITPQTSFLNEVKQTIHHSLDTMERP